jgi:hypothetical protein
MAARACRAARALRAGQLQYATITLPQAHPGVWAAALYCIQLWRQCLEVLIDRGQQQVRGRPA